ncbi:HU family DNA-binding protein [Granulibacter bethesdensis]|uniref:DNA-binding protein HU n=2 Tax=Granulibacter bethesdensis TaxID=364410 RepID=Q0BW86_GRABC|nr:HU family DNA-binding protein [Granulibacter bethesdensis]ABI60916.1 DNA-binding protein HU [Granulibacter bethesdensis CGDNIH1]AHJ61752.1 DNA-binding protein HU [Granulibacter bethesdensis]AHJ64376.1 DNA-binding protein HU [Granulibacter bethesdensis CGDNIH4]AHJ66998.1 DNA-binding protein HU [Granulibacter bethesdensis]APH50680.1 DNA-binding protein HU [Granulibacter bethesdensis]
MNHADLIDKIAKSTDQTKATVDAVVSAAIETISATLKAGEEVRISGLGIFDVSERAARQGRNPQTGATIEIAATRAARFRAGKALKDAVNGTAVKAKAKKA